ncbi:DUF302 domain-containing protein [Arcobacter aquimarinus]|uniref:DUF302 domain-containing protein n=1 Tax=Arcobacter aquimarinus TaxID=1315211 RepID=A0AAE7B694_9BACT|nr:DUF302 domain-containing protein [Arcobacter aquimarinus]QKE26435.1 DUF302 domain-containing protein [Arcobacter aquimarinus]RXI33430.1 hypothetical protein CP986_10630 [Arcobacter aquimarinus]
MQYIEVSNKSVQEVVEKIKEVCPKHKFGVQHIHNVKENLKTKGIDFKNECQIVDICNPFIAEQFLSIDMSLSIIMPCKISVYSENGQTNIAMNSLVQLVDDINPDMIETAQKVQEQILQIIDEVK